MRECKNTAAIVLAAGKGTRMESDIQKQYLELGGKPLIYYALKAFEDSPVKQVILVTGRGETGYCRKEIVERFGFQKVSQITEGGREIIAGRAAKFDFVLGMVADRKSTRLNSSHRL